jgi:hypothetical protein
MTEDDPLVEATAEALSNDDAVHDLEVSWAR